MNWFRRRFSGPTGFPLHEARYLVLDTETTGFDIQRDRILSIGWIEVHRGVISMASAREWFVDAGEALGNSPAIHGITRDELQGGGIPEDRAWAAFATAAGSVTALVAHYADFDRNMLEAMRKRCGGEALPAGLPWLDTMDLEVALNPGKAGNASALKLDTLLVARGIEAVRRHSALGDAFSTAMLLQRQLAQLRTAGVVNSDALHRPRAGLW